MALVRILVDGYSLLHQWARVAPGKPRHSELAKEELINRLTQYYDSSGTPMTVIFDQQGLLKDLGPFPSTRAVEIIHTHSRRNADQLIERVVNRMKRYGEVMVVTDDLAGQETAEAAGGGVCSCPDFIQMVDAALAELNLEIERYNQTEQLKFRIH